MERHINKPSLVTPNHIDIIYQIRQIIAQLRINVNFVHTHVSPKEIDNVITNKLKPNESQLNKIPIIESVPPDPNEIDIDDLHSTSSDRSSQSREI